MKQPTKGGMTCEMAQRAIALAAMASPEMDLTDLHLSDRDMLQTADPGHRTDEGVGLPSSGHDFAFDFAGNVFVDEDPIPDGSGNNDLGHPQPEPSHSEPTARFSSDLSRTGEQDSLAEHLRLCRSCQAEMAATTAFFRALASDSGPEPSATLLARSRMQLDASLDSCEQAPPWARIGQHFAFTAGRLRAAPALCSGLLLLGLLAGGYGGYLAGHAAHASDQTTLLLAPPAQEGPSVVADVTSISHDPASGMVEVRYDRLVPDVLTARADDPSIRELLMAATENATDSQVRNLSVNLLSGGCHAGAPCAAAPVRNALLNVLSSDKTPQVRREALAGLQPYIADDMEVRDAVLTALMSDPSASVRIEAVRLLQPVDVDSSVRQVLHTVAAQDGDPLIRSASLAALKNVPQIQ